MNAGRSFNPDVGAGALTSPIPGEAGGTSGRPRQPALRFLVVTLVACIVLPLVLLIYAAWNLDRDLHRQAERRISIELDVLMQHTLRVLQTANLAQDAIRLLTAGMTDDQIRAREPELHTAFKDLSNDETSVQSVWLIDRHGVPLVSDLVSPMPRLNVTDRDYFQSLQASDVGTYVGSVLVPKLTGPPFFAVGRRRVSLDGQFNGVITVSLLPTELERFYGHLAPDGAALYAMVRSDGAVLARFPEPSRPSYFLNPQTSPFLRELARNPEGGTYTAISSVDAIERIYRYRPVPGYPLFLIAGIQTARIRAEWRATLAPHLIFGVPATLLLLVTLSIAIRRTRRLYVESERRQAAEVALSRTQRLEAIGQLTGGVAHDFNNLLMIVSGSAERLRRRVTDPRDTRSLDTIERAVLRGSGLTRQLLTFASRQALAVEVIDLGQHLARLEDVLRRSLRGDIETNVEVPPGPCAVKVDPGELDLAILNITVNARDAMPDGGRISIRVRPVVLNGEPATDGLSGAFVAVVVRDTGFGIPPEALSRVFEPFFTTKEIGKGTGLGLSQVYGFTRQSGGTVTVSSEVGRGTAVTLYLPATTEMPLDAVATAVLDGAGGGGRRILVVEDTSDVAEVMRGLLQDVGFRVEVACSAREALDRLDADPCFDLVISDIVMPGEMKGTDLARELRRRSPNLPVLLISGYSASSEQAIREGFSMIRKPFDVDRLREVIEITMRVSGNPGQVEGSGHPAAAG